MKQTQTTFRQSDEQPVIICSTHSSLDQVSGSATPRRSSCVRCSASFAHSKRRPCGAPSRTAPPITTTTTQYLPNPKTRPPTRTRTDSPRQAATLNRYRSPFFSSSSSFSFFTHRVTAPGDKSSSAPAGEHAPCCCCRCCCSATLPAVKAEATASFA